MGNPNPSFCKQNDVRASSSQLDDCIRGRLASRLFSLWFAPEARRNRISFSAENDGGFAPQPHHLLKKVDENFSFFPFRKIFFYTKSPLFSKTEGIFASKSYFRLSPNWKPSSSAFFKSSSLGTNTNRKGSPNTLILRPSRRAFRLAAASPLQP